MLFARQLLLDGIVSSPQDLVVSDVFPGYWDIGRDILFQDYPKISEISTIFIDLAVPFLQTSVLLQPNSFNLISAQLILHVFSKDQCQWFLENIYTLLKPKNSLLFGTCAGVTGVAGPQEWGVIPTKGFKDREDQKLETPRLLHTKDTLMHLLSDIIGFVDVSVVEMKMPTTFKSDNDHIIGSETSGVRVMLAFSGKKKQCSS